MICLLFFFLFDVPRIPAWRRRPGGTTRSPPPWCGGRIAATEAAVSGCGAAWLPWRRKVAASPRSRNPRTEGASGPGQGPDAAQSIRRRHAVFTSHITILYMLSHTSSLNLRKSVKQKASERVLFRPSIV